MKRRFRKTIIINSLIIFVMSLFIALSLARYQSALAGKTGVNIASPVVELNTMEDDLIYMNPYDYINQDYFFEVTNKDENDFESEVTMKYKLEILGIVNLPIELSVYKYNENTSLYDIEVDIVDNESVSEYTLEQGQIADKYKLHLEWIEDIDDYRYSKTIDYIRVKADASQVD